jgi:hypothetical protein
MMKKRTDFRLLRCRIPDKDFAVIKNNKKKPTRLISKEAWKHFTDLPTDVALWTSQFLGSEMDFLHELEGYWIEEIIAAFEAAKPNCIPSDALSGIEGALLNFEDDFSSAVFNLMHGYYKTSIGCLRNSLEFMAFECAYLLIVIRNIDDHPSRNRLQNSREETKTQFNCYFQKLYS